MESLVKTLAANEMTHLTGELTSGVLCRLSVEVIHAGKSIEQKVKDWFVKGSWSLSMMLVILPLQLLYRSKKSNLAIA